MSQPTKSIYDIGADLLSVEQLQRALNENLIGLNLNQDGRTRN